MSKRKITMVGNSRGYSDGDEVQVDSERAEELVREGLARFATEKATAEAKSTS